LLHWLYSIKRGISISVWEALILGVVQGITEFLPVSSSGHLVLLQKIFAISEPALVFDTVVHGGTMIAVIVVLRRDILNVLNRIFQPLTLHLIIATLPAVAAALLFKHRIENAFASGSFLGFAFIATSILLFTAERLFRGAGQFTRSGEGAIGALPAETEEAVRFQDEMTFADALIIGLFQAVAIIPGISRSGATISGALSRRLDRDFAARFSFLLSIPAIFGALVLQARDLYRFGISPEGTDVYAPIGLLSLAVGALSAAIVAFFSIRLALKIVRERTLKGFALYTGIIGLLVLLDKFAFQLFF
jgi:undecaprenyl-diphosphatase